MNDRLGVMEVDFRRGRAIFYFLFPVNGLYVRKHFGLKVAFCNAAPESIPGGPPSYICRLSGHSVEKSWRFWLEVSD